MSRRELREHCFKMLFCTEFYPDQEIQEQLHQYFQAPLEEETTKEGVDEILHTASVKETYQNDLINKVNGVLEKKTQLDADLDAIAKGWTTKRMAKADLSILRLALFEMNFDEDVPKGVAINEAVELAKKFGGEDSSAFINGILAKLV